MNTKAKPTLKGVEPGKATPSRPKILVYGKPGVGKTWTALDFPSVYYMDTEGGADLEHYQSKLKASGGVYFGPEHGSLDFEEVIGQIQALATNKHTYKTVVIDSITKIFNLAIAQEAERLGDKNAFGADKKPAIAYMRQLVNWLSRLDMNVVLVAHEKPLWGKDDSGQRAEVGVTFDGWDKLEYELHLALNVVKAGPKRLAKVTKSRLLEFKDGDTLTWSFEEFAKRYGRDVIDREAIALELATEEQLQTLRVLLDNVKLPDGTVDKWLTAASATTFEEMDTDKVAKIINHLRAKINPEKEAA